MCNTLSMGKFLSVVESADNLALIKFSFENIQLPYRNKEEPPPTSIFIGVFKRYEHLKK